MVVIKRLLVAAIVLASYLSSLCAAQQLNSADSKSNDAFREQLAAIGQSSRAGDTATVQKLIDQFRLPNQREWFSEHLGAEQSSELAMRYDRLFANFAESLQHTVEFIAANRDAELVPKLENGKGESPTNVRRPGAKLSGMVSIHPPPLFYGHFKITIGKTDTTSWADTFVLEDGAFRFIGVGAWPFWVWQDGSEGSLPKGGSFSTPPILVSRVNAVYPADARSKNIEGVVTLRVVIDKEGRVKQADVQSGDALLTQAALDAVRQWRYKPATLGGAASESDAIVNITFSLPR